MAGFSVRVHQSADLAIAFPNDPRYRWAIVDEEAAGRVVATGWITYATAEQPHAEAVRVLSRLGSRLAG
jgi:hypothetical protein